MAKPNDIKTPIHPGEILREEFLEPMNLTQYRLARELRVAPIRVSQIIHGKRSITADTALRLSRYFGNSAEFWLGLQMQYDIETARDHLAGRIDKEIKPKKRSA